MSAYTQELIAFLLQAVGISLSGVMAPGPVTAATVAAGARYRHAGMMVAVGHGMVEFPLMILIVLGVGRLLEVEGVRIGIGLAGGGFLLWMGVGMLRGLGKTSDTTNRSVQRHPVWTGVILSGGNPYFLLWWATVGLALATQSLELGVFAFALFALVHWLCDAVWLEALSLASHKGSTLLGGRPEKVVLGVCGAALVVFACMFVYDAGGKLFGSSG